MWGLKSRFLSNSVYFEKFRYFHPGSQLHQFYLFSKYPRKVIFYGSFTITYVQLLPNFHSFSWRLIFFRFRPLLAVFGKLPDEMARIKNCHNFKTGCPTGMKFYKINCGYCEGLNPDFYQIRCILKNSGIFTLALNYINFTYFRNILEK